MGDLEQNSHTAKRLSLKYERPFFATLPQDGDIFEGGHQNIVLAEADGHDVALWIAPYVLHGYTQDGMLADNAATLGIIEVHVPTKLRGSMHDSDFVCQGWMPTDFVKTDELKVDSTRSDVTWKIKDSEFRSRPSHWEVRGHSGTVGYNLSMEGLGPTAWCLGDFDRIVETRAVDFNQLTSCSGTITVGEKTLNITEGYGYHGHSVLVSMPGKEYRGGTYYFFAGGTDFQLLSIVTNPGAAGHRCGHMRLGKQFFHFGSAIDVDVLEWWQDPRSLAKVPCKWQLNMQSAEGVLNLRAVASGRANRVWCLRNGYMLDVWLLGTMSGAFVHKGGEVIPIKETLFSVQCLRRIWP